MISMPKALLFSVALLSSCFGVGAGSAVAQSTESGESVEDLATRFGVRASVLDVTLSPSGTKIAWIAGGPGHAEVLMLADLAAGTGIKSIDLGLDVKTDLERCDWVTEERLVCQIWGIGDAGGVLIPFSRMFAINSDGSDVIQLSERSSRRAFGFNQFGGSIVSLASGDKDGRILVTRDYVKENTTGTRFASAEEGRGVDEINVENGRRKVKERADPVAIRYVADEKGEIRLKARAILNSTDRLSGDYIYLYRKAGSSKWTQFESLSLDGEPIDEFIPVAVDSERDVAFGYVEINGYDALIQVPLDGVGLPEIVLARDDVDVGGLIRIGRQRRTVGVSYATEKASVRYIDEELAELASGLGKALPDQPLITFADASSDESKLLIIASSDTDPGTVYLYDKATKSLQQLLAIRDLLVNVPMGKMKPVTYPASDGTDIPGYLTLPPGSDGKNLPAVVLPHGGPSARDVWGFDWLVQFFTARGYAVLQPNYRGSTGYGEAWYGKNGFQAWNVAIDDVNDAGKWLVSEGIADPGKLVIAGWSYGGYAALQSQTVAPDLYKAVVAIAPVTDLNYLRDDFRRFSNSDLVEEFIGDGPHLRTGSPRRFAERFQAPVALFHGTGDLNVNVRHSRAMEDALEDADKQVSYTEYKDLQHDLGDSNVRKDMLVKIDAFLTEALAP